jgi:hypothetical protein
VKILESVYRRAPKILTVVSGRKRCSSHDSTGLHDIFNCKLKKKIGISDNWETGKSDRKILVGEIEMPINAPYTKINSAYEV